jgi:hypothetical protein
MTPEQQNMGFLYKKQKIHTTPMPPHACLSFLDKHNQSTTLIGVNRWHFTATINSKPRVFG